MLKKILLSLGLMCLLLVLTILGLILFPSVSYANVTKIGAIHIHHQHTLAPEWTSIIQQASEARELAEIYREDVTIDLCIDTSSFYNWMIRQIFREEVFALGFANKTVIQCEANPKENYAKINGRKRKLDELLTHEFIHNDQYNIYGFKTLRFPFWKLEGYASYIMVHPNHRRPLTQMIPLLLEEKGKGSTHWDWLELGDGTGTTINYFQSRLLVRYLMEEKGMTYDEIISDTTAEQIHYQDMIHWYEAQTDYIKKGLEKHH